MSWIWHWRGEEPGWPSTKPEVHVRYLGDEAWPPGLSAEQIQAPAPRPEPEVRCRVLTAFRDPTAKGSVRTEGETYSLEGGAARELAYINRVQIIEPLKGETVKTHIIADSNGRPVRVATAEVSDIWDEQRRKREESAREPEAADTEVEVLFGWAHGMPDGSATRPGQRLMLPRSQALRLREQSLVTLIVDGEAERLRLAKLREATAASVRARLEDVAKAAEPPAAVERRPVLPNNPVRCRVTGKDGPLEGIRRLSGQRVGIAAIADRPRWADVGFEGDEIELNDEPAERLLAQGRVELVEEPASEAKAS